MESKRVGAKHAVGTHYAFMASKKAGALFVEGMGFANIQGFVASASSVDVSKICSSIARSRDWHWKECSLLELLHEQYIGRIVSIASGIVHGSCSLITAAIPADQHRVVASASVDVD